MRRRTPQEKEDIEKYMVDVSELTDPTMTVGSLVDIVKRNKRYNELRTLSGLTHRAWCEVLGISDDRERSYAKSRVRVPNLILNRAYIASKRIKRAITNLKKGITKDGI